MLGQITYKQETQVQRCPPVFTTSRLDICQIFARFFSQSSTLKRGLWEDYSNLCPVAERAKQAQGMLYRCILHQVTFNMHRALLQHDPNYHPRRSASKGIDNQVLKCIQHQFCIPSLIRLIKHLWCSLNVRVEILPKFV